MEGDFIVIEFEPFPKIARLSRECVITEKLDGTNAQVIITEEGEIAAASRNRLITPGKTTDNNGFAAWVEEHKAELVSGLGPGRHFGEWYGRGIQRTYGLDHKRFALFNVHRWNTDNIPECCSVVPTLAITLFDTEVIDNWLETLTLNGSYAVPGFMKPEGIIILHSASRTLFKKTIEQDAIGKEQ